MVIFSNGGSSMSDSDSEFSSAVIAMNSSNSLKISSSRRVPSMEWKILLPSSRRASKYSSNISWIMSILKHVSSFDVKKRPSQDEGNFAESSKNLFDFILVAYEFFKELSIVRNFGYYVDKSIDIIHEMLEEYFDALLDEGSKIFHSIEGTLLEEEIFTEFDEFMAMTADENSESESDIEEPPFEKITI
nr:reverse transcriptase domain-containing protein [Tanacetum cinerariifolium]